MFPPLKYFRRTDAWGDPDAINTELLLMLDGWRLRIGLQFYVTFGTQGAHVADWHRRGLAVDGVLDLAGTRPLDAIFTAMRFPFHGIGVYPRAKHPKAAHPLGFHFDLRGDENLSDRAAKHWIAVPSEENGQLIDQFPLDEKHLRLFGLM